MRRKALLFICFLVLMSGVIGEASAKRVALVIANSDYEHAEKLANPGNDAKALADAFKRMNFDTVTLKENLDYRNMRLALKDFANTSAGAELALVYFAGHGIEVGGQNYLIPTDARLETATDVDFEGIPLPNVMSSVEGANNLKLVILDACRNNPFRARMIRRSGTRSVGRGLAKIEPEGNTLVAFAAKEGTVALDGDGKHSPYANALLQVVEETGVEIGFMFRRVRDMVLQTTGLRQEPFTYGSLGGTPIYLKPPEEKVAEVKETEKAESEDRISALRKELDELKKQFSLSNKSGQEDDKVVVASADTKTRDNSTSTEFGGNPEPAKEDGASTQDEFSGSDSENNPDTKVASSQSRPTKQEKAAVTGQQTGTTSATASRELVADIQRELARLNCNPGNPDGLWGLRTSSAIANANNASGQDLDTTKADEKTLEALRAMKAPVCTAAVPQVVKNKPTQPTTKKPYQAQQKKTQPQKKQTQKKKEYWGGESTRIDCERGRITADCF